MNTIVFRGEQKTIFDLYIPLTIEKRGREDEVEIVIDEKAIEKIRDYKKIMIVDSAGMGKSTLAKYISVQSIIQKSYIPIVVELRKLTHEKDIWKYLCNAFDMMNRNLECDDIKSLIKKGGFLIIFDGYDEIAEDLRSSIISQITEFTNKADENVYILSSREEEDLSSFGDFSEFRIKPLSLKEAFDLINKYGDNGERAKRLINVINQERKNFAVIKEFLINPLLVSLLYKTFEYKEELPYKKVEFYRQVYEALFNDHDKSKDAYIRPKKCGLAIREFECVLRYFAFFSMQKWCVEYESIQDLERDVKDAIENAFGVDNVKSEDFIHDILHAVPIFQRDGGAYRWAHKSFMEYFAAQCIYLEMDTNIKQKLLANMSENEKGAKYYNILDFYYDMDLKSIRKYVMKPFLEKYISVSDKLRTRILEEGLSVSDEMLDIIASIDSLLDYKIIYVGKYDVEDDEEDENRKIMELFNRVSDKYGKGNLTLSAKCMIMWHYNTKQNIYLPRLFSEKYVDLSREFSTENFLDEEDEWIYKMGEKYEYIDDAIVLLKMGVEEEKIKELYDNFYYTRNKILCLDVKKCKNELQKICKEISKEQEMSKERFLQLECN